MSIIRRFHPTLTKRNPRWPSAVCRRVSLPSTAVRLLHSSFAAVKGILNMEDTSSTAINYEGRVKGNLQLRSETFSIKSSKGILSQQLAAMKEESMSILTDFITRHNVPNDVPDESIEGSSGDEAKELDNPPKKSKN